MSLSLLRTIRVRDFIVLLLLVLILAATLVPWTASSFVAPRFRPGVTFHFLASDYVANVLLFGILGFALTFRGASFVATVLFGVALSFSVEAAQMWIPSRVTSFWDWLANSSGTLIGASFLARFPYAFSPSDKQAERLSLAFALLWCAVLVASGILLKPAPVTAELAYLQAPPRYANGTRWTGKLDTIEINGTPHKRGKVTDVQALLRSLEGDFTLLLRGLAPAHSSERRPLFAVSAHRPTTSIPVVIWTADQDLLVSYHSIGDHLTFRDATYRAKGMGAHLKPHQPFELRLSRTQDETCVAIGNVRNCAVAVSIDEAWIAWLVDLDRWRASSFCAGLLWLAAIAAPLGYYFRASATGFGAASVLIGSLLLIPLFTPLRAMGFQSWLIFCTCFALAAWSATRRGDVAGVKSHDVDSDS